MAKTVSYHIPTDAYLPEAANVFLYSEESNEKPLKLVLAPSFVNTTVGSAFALRLEEELYKAEINFQREDDSDEQTYLIPNTMRHHQKAADILAKMASAYNALDEVYAFTFAPHLPNPPSHLVMWRKGSDIHLVAKPPLPDLPNFKNQLEKLFEQQERPSVDINNIKILQDGALRHCLEVIRVADGGKDDPRRAKYATDIFRNLREEVYALTQNPAYRVRSPLSESPPIVLAPLKRQPEELCETPSHIVKIDPAYLRDAFNRHDTGTKRFSLN